jgi:hypothetical protein
LCVIIYFYYNINRCTAAWFDNGSTDCEACTYPCSNCVNSATECETCVGTNRVTVDVNNLDCA